MQTGNRSKKKNRSRNKTSSVEQHQGDQTQQNYQQLEHICDQVNSNAPSISQSFAISASLVRSTGNDPKYLGNSNVPSKNDRSHYYRNKEQHKETNNGNTTIDDIQQADDTFLINSIESASQDRALQLLEGNHLFSQDGLDKALMLACQHGHKYLVQTLVSLGANVQFQDTKGNTPLMICAENGFTDMVRFLLAGKADVNAVNYAGDTALILSIRSSGSVEMVDVLRGQKEINIHHQNRDGYTALMKAVEVKDIDTMNILLNKMYDYNHSINYFLHDHHFQESFHDQNMDYMMHKAEIIAEKCGLGNVFRFLSKSRNTEKSSLELAIEEGDSKSLKILMTCQFVYYCDIKRCVQLAVEESDSKSLKILLHCQFLNEYDMKKAVGKVFIKLFTKCEMQEVKTFNDKEIAMIEILLDYGANVDLHFNDCNPVSVAVEAGNYQLVELLCKHGALLSHTWYGGKSGPLPAAAKIGRFDLIELLLKYEYKANINQIRFYGSALDCALSHGHVDCAKRLIQLGATLDIEHALISAVNQQLPEYMNFLFDNYKQEALNHLEKTESQSNLLILAVKGGNLKIISHILDAGADVNQPTNTGVTPLVESKNGEVAQLLIQRGADVSQMIDSKRSGRFTPVIHVLMTRYAYDSHTLELVKVLLENGASINGIDKTNRTALMMAAPKKGSVDMLQLLLDHGADPNDKDDDGNTALIIALTNGCYQNVSFLLQFTTNTNILNAHNKEGSTVLIYAVSRGKHKIVIRLLKLGVDVNATDAQGNTALMRAIMESFTRKNGILTSLIRAGSDINYQNNEGLSPLMLAANKVIKDAMQILLTSGADVNAVSKTNRTRTALSCLFDNLYYRENTKCCLEYLLERGASASYVSPLALIKIIINGYTEVIPKMIQRGLGPADIKSNRISHRVVEPGLVLNVSPLCMTLLVGNIDLAHYFMGNLFLTNSDVSSLTCNKDLRRILERENHQVCLNFLDEMSSQLFSLFKLSFIAVSAFIGTSPGREDRVNLLPLPQVMKDKLLFKTEEVSLIIPTANK